LKGSEITNGRRAPIRSAKRAAAATVPHPNSTALGRRISIGVKELVIGRPVSSLWSCGGAAGQSLGVVDGLDQAVLVGNAFACDVEGRAVIDGGADDRKPQRDVDAGKLLPAAGRGIDLEAEQFYRNVPLVVIHRDHRIELAGAQLDEDGVPRHRPDDVEAVINRLSESRRRDVDILPPEQPALTGMWIERRNGDLGPRDAKPAQRVVGEI